MFQYPLPLGQNFVAPFPSPDCVVLDSTPLMVPVPPKSHLTVPSQGMQVAPMMVVTYERPKKERGETPEAPKLFGTPSGGTTH